MAVLLAVRLQPGIYTEHVAARQQDDAVCLWCFCMWPNILLLGPLLLLLLCECTQQAFTTWPVRG